MVSAALKKRRRRMKGSIKRENWVRYEYYMPQYDSWYSITGLSKLLDCTITSNVLRTRLTDLYNGIGNLKTIEECVFNPKNKPQYKGREYVREQDNKTRNAHYAEMRTYKQVMQLWPPGSLAHKERIF